MNIKSQQGIAPVAIVVAVLVVLVIAIGGYFLVVRSNVTGLAPDIRLNQAFDKLLEETSANVSVNADVTSGQAGEEPEADLNVSLMMEGMPLPGNDEEHPATQGSASISGTVEGETMSLEAEFRSLPPRTFFRLSSLAIPDAGDAQSLFAAAVGQWVYLDAEDETEMGDMNEMMQDFSPISLPRDCDPMEQQKVAVEAYLESLTFTDFVSNIQIVGSEAATGGEPDRSMTRFSMELDEEKAKGVAQEVERLSGCEVDEEAEESEVDVTNLEVLVGDQTGLLRGIDATVQAEDDTTIQAVLRLSNFSQPPVVAAPEGAISLEELMSQMMEEMFGDMIKVEDFPTEEEIDEMFEGTGMEYNLP